MCHTRQTIRGLTRKRGRTEVIFDYVSICEISCLWITTLESILQMTRVWSSVRDESSCLCILRIILFEILVETVLLAVVSHVFFFKSG